MKAFKVVCMVAVAAILLAPASAFAKTHLSFSFNLVEHCRPLFVPAPRPPVVVQAPPVYVPCPQPYTVVQEYHHYYHPAPQVQQLVPVNPYPYHIPPYPYCP